jgi:predicted RNase H-like HicB family nuclease
MSRSVLSWISRARAIIIEEVRRDLQEALELFFKTADTKEVKQRLHDEDFVTRLEVVVG